VYLLYLCILQLHQIFDFRGRLFASLLAQIRPYSFILASFDAPYSRFLRFILSRPRSYILAMAHGAEQVTRANEQLMRITTAFLVLAWVFVSLRVWTRTFILSNFGWDDATMIFAAVSSNVR
jgi:hypothetical protein